MDKLWISFFSGKWQTNKKSLLTKSALDIIVYGLDKSKMGIICFVLEKYEMLHEI